MQLPRRRGRQQVVKFGVAEPKSQTAKRAQTRGQEPRSETSRIEGLPTVASRSPARMIVPSNLVCTGAVVTIMFGMSSTINGSLSTSG